ARADYPRGRHRARRAAAARFGHGRTDRHAHVDAGQAGNPAAAPRRHRAGGGAAHGVRPRGPARRGLHGGASMSARATRIALTLAFFFALTAQRDPILVPEVSQHGVQVRQGFTGTELLLFGAILDADGTRASQPYDIVVVLKGPTQPILLREKDKKFGIWLNAHSTSFRS